MNDSPLTPAPTDEASSGFRAVAGSALLTRLYNHRATMAPHQRERHTGKLLLESIAEIERLRDIIGRAGAAFCEDGSDGKAAAAMFAILAETDRLNA